MKSYLSFRIRVSHPDIKFEQIIGTDLIEYLDRIINTKIRSRELF